MAIERDLAAPLDARRVQSRVGGAGNKLSYLTTHDVKRTANRIFGFDGWSYTVNDLISLGEEPFKNSKGREGIRVGYRAVVTVTIGEVRRGDVGYGDAMEYNGSRITPHELASKEAVSDALKRCLSSWGDQFGLVLYGADPAPPPADDVSEDPRPAPITPAPVEPPAAPGAEGPDGDEHRRAHETPSTADLKLPPADRRVITDAQASKLVKKAQGYGLSGAQTLEIIVSQTGKARLGLVERYQFDALLAEVDACGKGVSA